MRGCQAIPAVVQWLYVAAMFVGPAIGLVVGFYAGRTAERARAEDGE